MLTFAFFLLSSFDSLISPSPLFDLRPSILGLVTLFLSSPFFYLLSSDIYFLFCSLLSSLLSSSLLPFYSLLLLSSLLSPLFAFISFTSNRLPLSYPSRRRIAYPIFRFRSSFRSVGLNQDLVSGISFKRCGIREREGRFRVIPHAED